MKEDMDILALASTPMSIQQLQDLSKSILMDILAEREQMREQMHEQKEEHKRRMEEYDRRNKEYDRRKEESRKEWEESKKELNRQIRDINTRFTSQSGHIVEGLMEPSALHIFQAAGFDIDKCWKEMKGRNKALGLKMEVDLFLHDTVESIAVEVKINCTNHDIDHFIEQLGKFKSIFHEYANSTVYGAIAAINFDREADKYAAEKGLFVIRVSNDDIFTLDPADKSKMLTF